MHDRAGLTARPEDLIDLDALIGAYETVRPDMADPMQRVVFGTSGHRGSSLDGAFNQAHILAIAQSIAEYRAAQGVDGPLFLARDTHGLSEPAFRTTLQVLVANGVEVLIDARDGFTPTPAVSHAILTHNRTNPRQADGVLITPSHNPPRDGGIKYNPPSGGPAGGEATSAIAARANRLIEGGLSEVRRVPFAQAHATAGRFDYLSAYIDDLPRVSGPGRHSKRRGPHRRRSAGRRGRRLLGRDRDPAPAGPDRGQRRRRSALGLHAIGRRRQDPHGLFVALGHGRTDRHDEGRLDL